MLPGSVGYRWQPGVANSGPMGGSNPSGRASVVQLLNLRLPRRENPLAPVRSALLGTGGGGAVPSLDLIQMLVQALAPQGQVPAVPQMPMPRSMAAPSLPSPFRSQGGGGQGGGGQGGGGLAGQPAQAPTVTGMYGKIGGWSPEPLPSFDFLDRSSDSSDTQPPFETSDPNGSKWQDSNSLFDGGW